MREAEIEKKVCDYAKSKGWLCYKFSSPSQRGVPDRIFMKDGKMFFIEFKAPGKKPTKLQRFKAHDIECAGFTTYWTDSVEQGKDLIDTIECAHAE